MHAHLEDIPPPRDALPQITEDQLLRHNLCTTRLARDNVRECCRRHSSDVHGIHRHTSATTHPEGHEGVRAESWMTQTRKPNRESREQAK